MGKRILIADDDPVIRTLVGDYLATFSHEIEIVESGSACLARLGETVPDLLFLDLMMPDMSGMEVLQSIRGNQSLEKLPVVMFSAHNDIKQVTDQFNLTPDYFIQKPFNMSDLLKVVETAKR